VARSSTGRANVELALTEPGWSRTASGVPSQAWPDRGSLLSLLTGRSAKHRLNAARPLCAPPFTRSWRRPRWGF